MYIIPSKYSETEIEVVTKTVSEQLEKRGAKTVKTQNLGKQKFAYPIKKNTHGTYILSYVEMEGEHVAQVDADLRLEEGVLRHILIKREDGIPEYEVKLSAYTAPITPEGKRATKKKAVVADQPKVEAPQEKISKEEIEQKLDEILDDDTLSEEAK